MAIDSFLAWREPIAASWREEIAHLAACLKHGEELAPLQTARLRRLAAMRLGDGERLWLRRLLQQVRKLAKPLAGYRRFRILVVSNRVTSFLAGEIEVSGAARGLLIEVLETDYDAARRIALGQAGDATEERVDAVLLLLDFGFFQAEPALLDEEREAGNTRAVAAQLATVVEGLRARFRAPLIAATVAPAPELQISSADLAMAGTPVRLVQAVNQAISACAEAGLVVLFDLAALAARIGSTDFFDPAQFHLAKVPFSMVASPVVADSLAALIAAMCGLSGRALVLDLDNTLWGGVVADDGLPGIVVGQGSPDGEAFHDIQNYALELRRRGVVLAVVSKNLEEVARQPFRSHPDMLLREEHLTVFLANFDDKATNVARAAQMLDLDPSALVFLDDNPAERERVRSALPWVMVPELGDDPASFVRALASCGFFEQLQLTGEDVQRAASYQARSEARALQQEIGDYDAYLKSLDMEATISPFDAVGRPRIAQLIQKSNQFNLTSRRYSEAEIEAFERDDAHIAWQVRLKDRFADHGMISAVVVAKTATDWTIENWVMSCRVLERGVEAAIVGELARLALSAGVQTLCGVYLPTDRNMLVKDLYPRLGFEPVSVEADGASTYRLGLASASLPSGAIRVNCA